MKGQTSMAPTLKNNEQYFYTNHLKTKITSKDEIKTLDYIFCHVNRDIIDNIIIDAYYFKDGHNILNVIHMNKNKLYI